MHSLAFSRLKWISATAMLAVTAHRAAAQRTDTLTTSQVADVSHGQVVLMQWPIDDAPWPRVRLYRFIEASPEQSAAMLADYEHEKDYNADLKEAKIVRRLDSARTEVFFRYASNVPLVSDVTYTVLEQLQRGADGTYTLAWHLLNGSKMKSVEGSARFSPWKNPATGRDGTLLTYDQLVVPNFRGASLGLVRRKAIAAMRDAVEAIAIETARERTSDKALLDRQVATLRAALAY